MDLDPVEARRKAQQLIENIANEHTLNGQVFGTKLELLTNNCLEILTNQLYEKNTHFLLELIQNADDNVYTCTTPTVSFIYKPGFLRIDCNEVGFDADNVAAICGISESTKSGKRSDGEFIGEKGIGFKSIYKAADVVWIASNEFTFKFDRRQPLGVIIPIWEEFPEPTEGNGTSFLLQLSPAYDEKILIRELHELDTNLLVFLRRVKEINIEINHANGNPWKKRISKTQHEKGSDRVVALQAGPDFLQYLSRSHILRDLPEEVKRRNWTQTSILLAFPISGDGEKPPGKTQSVYAFLPIRNYGFRFLIQADFLLTASREEIESTLPWNITIRDALPEIFLSSMFHFNAGVLKYVWPYYLPSLSTSVPGFFEPAVEAILTQLAKSPVFETCAGDMATPSTLVHVPPEFCTGGQPFTSCGLTQARYLSSKYANWTIEAMSSVGVSELTSRQFLEDLATLIATDAERFHAKSFEWHSQLARTLVKLCTDDDLLISIKNLSIIPLNDGAWVPARDNNIFFAKNEVSLSIPDGIRVLIVDPNVESDLNRRTLFTSLGVKTWDASEICRLIVQLHSSVEFEPKQLATAQLVSHTVFLYKAAWQPPKDTDIWFATASGQRCHGGKLYIPRSASTNSASSRVFAILQKRFPIMHDDYLTALAEDPAWPDWLVQNLRLSRIPRLVTPVIEPRPEPMKALVLKDASSSVELEPPVHDPSSGFHIFSRSPSPTRSSPKPSKNQPVQPPAHQSIPPQAYSNDERKDNDRDAEGVKYQSDTSGGEKWDYIDEIEDDAPGLPRRVEHKESNYFDPGTSSSSWNSSRQKETSKHRNGSEAREKDQHPRVKRDKIDYNYQWDYTKKKKPASPPNEREILEREGSRRKKRLKDESDSSYYPYWRHDSYSGYKPYPKYAYHTPPPNNADYSGYKPYPKYAYYTPPYTRKTTYYDESPTSVTEAIPMSTVADPALHEKDSRIIRDTTDAIERNIQDDEEIQATESESSESGQLLFNLSEEFEFMLRECNSSDVLKIVRDHWHHYSQWLEGGHLNWQSKEYVSASTQLKKEIGNSLARTTRGPLPLNETVLKKPDMQLDRSNALPILEIEESEHPGWSLLACFGVAITGDVNYYLRCLSALATDENPDIDSVNYIYEQLQSKYTGNEEIIRAAFYSKDVVLVSPESHSSIHEAYWIRLEDCLSEEIDVASAYPNCSYLFRCLLSPSGDPIGGLVHSMTMINSFSKLEDITRMFRELSMLLKDLSTSKAALLLKPLQSKAIFPVIQGPRDSGFDMLLDAHDKYWFIADQANLVASFTGVVPLLALSIQELPAVEDIFRVLRVNNRKISKMTTSETRVMGNTRSDFRRTDELRSKIPFIRALIPRNHPDQAALRHQITELRVRIATAVTQTFTLKVLDQEVHGNSIPGHVSMTSTDGMKTLLMTEEVAAAECPPHELVNMLAEMCGIKDHKHVALLLTALSKLSLKSIEIAFSQQGIKVEGLSLDEPKARGNLLKALHGIDGARMPSPFKENLMHGKSSDLGAADGLQFGPNGNRGDEQYQSSDRRVPMLQRDKDTGSTYSKIPLNQIDWKGEEFIDWDYMQYFGENMVARLLRVHLGSSFDPERDWTSGLRERAGYTWIEKDNSVSPFTLTNADSIRRMTDLVIEYGDSQSILWRERLKTTLPNYHIDVLVSGGETGEFIMHTTWLERMINLKFPSHRNEDIKNVNVLIQVAHAHSEANFCFDIVVDPWHLVHGGKLKFSKNWLLQASLGNNERTRTRSDKVDNASLTTSGISIARTENRLVLYNMPHERRESGLVEMTESSDGPEVTSLYLPWSQSEATGILKGHGSSLHIPGRRKLYSYKPLLPGYMRLLYLLPANDQGPLHAVLAHIPCNHAGTYQALSYVWGSDIREKELMTPDGMIPITISLHKALEALRQSSQAVVIWADAVCINQADNKEKAQQISLMPDIFQACECTYAFLSVGSTAVDQALEMLMQVRCKAVLEERQRSKKEDADDKHLDWPQGVPVIPKVWQDNRIPPLDLPIWTSVRTLFALPYFRRAWIIQEIVAARNVKLVCGKWVVDWNDFYLAMEIIEREVQIADSDEDTEDLRAAWEPFISLAAQREWEARQHRLALLILVEHFRYAESTLSRDRLFALVGLASDGNEAAFEPDYSSSFKYIVLKFARAFVGQGRGIQLLYRAGISGSEHDATFPSWIPDWTSKRPIGLHDTSDTGLTFSACGPQAADVTLGPGPEELSVGGYDMDIILTISSARNLEPEWAAYFTEVDAMIDAGVLSGTMGPKKDLMWKVPVAAAPFPRSAGAGSTDMKTSYAAFRQMLTGPSHRSSSSSRGFSKNAHKSYMTCLKGTLAGWKFVVTKRGFVGVVPELSQVGDAVAIMKGGCVPFVIRDNGERWRLIGECYIHGIMKGEGLWLPGVKERTFCLY